jgi:PAS domain-containing protein
MEHAIVMIDAEGDVTYWDATAEKFFGYASTAVIGRSIDLIIAAGRGVREPVEQVEHGWVDVGTDALHSRHRAAQEVVEVVALVLGEPQRPRQRGDHLFAWLRAAALLEFDVVLDRRPGQHRHLIASQPGHPAVRAGRDPDVGPR